jgi:hypothetical protein
MRVDGAELLVVDETTGAVLTLNDRVTRLAYDGKERLILAGFQISLDLLNPFQLEKMFLASLVNADVPESATKAAVWEALETAALFNQN